jgi:2-methylcitrate dehydratase PrpD
MNKVVLVKDPRIEATFPQEWPASVAIELEDGERYEKFVRFPKGDPENPLSWDEMAAKFRALAGGDEIIAAISTAKPAALPAMCN